MTVVRGQRTGQNGNTQNYMGDIDHNPNWFCGWVFAMNMDPLDGTAPSRCASDWSMVPSQFSQYVNCETCNGGWTVRLAHDVTYYRNVYPWAPNHAVHHPSISRPAGYEVHWRYVSEDGNWVAISDQNVQHLKWFFVPKSALPNICGGGRDAKSPTTLERQNWGLVMCKSAAEGG